MNDNNENIMNPILNIDYKDFCSSEKLSIPDNSNQKNSNNDLQNPIFGMQESDLKNSVVYGGQQNSLNKVDIGKNETETVKVLRRFYDSDKTNNSKYDNNQKATQPIYQNYYPNQPCYQVNNSMNNNFYNQQQMNCQMNQMNFGNNPINRVNYSQQFFCNQGDNYKF